VIEVISPATRSYNLVEKAKVYRDAGVTEYWIFDPEPREVTVHRVDRPENEVLVRQGGRLESTAVPGFCIEVAWL